MATQSAQHTIVLIQPTKKPDGRTYSDFKGINEAMEGVCKLFEEHLKRQNPTKPQITYDVADLFDFIARFEFFNIYHVFTFYAFFILSILSQFISINSTLAH